MRSTIEKFTSAATALAVAGVLLLLGTAPAAAHRGGPAADAGVAAAMGGDPEDGEFDWAKLHDLTDHSRDCIDNAYVKGCVQPYGDVFWLRDDEWDGLDVRLWWDDVQGPRDGLCQDAEGYGDWARCNKRLPDGHLIEWATSWYADGEWQFSEHRTTVI